MWSEEYAVTKFCLTIKVTKSIIKAFFDVFMKHASHELANVKHRIIKAVANCYIFTLSWLKCEWENFLYVSLLRINRFLFY